MDFMHHNCVFTTKPKFQPSTRLCYLVQGRAYNHLSASDATLTDMGKWIIAIQQNNKIPLTKQHKTIVYVFGIYSSNGHY